MRSNLLCPLLCVVLCLPHALGAAPRKKGARSQEEEAPKQAPAPPAPEETAPAQPAAEAQTQSSEELEEVRQLDQQVKQHTDAAERYLQEKKYELAVKELQEAYKLDGQPMLLLKAGLAYQRMGKAKEAIEMYQNFLQEEPTTPLRKETEGQIRELRAKLEQDARPLWKKAWFWGIIAGSVVVVAGIGVGLGLGLPRTSSAAIE